MGLTQAREGNGPETIPGPWIDREVVKLRDAAMDRSIGGHGINFATQGMFLGRVREKWRGILEGARIVHSSAMLRLTARCASSPCFKVGQRVRRDCCRGHLALERQRRRWHWSGALGSWGFTGFARMPNTAECILLNGNVSTVSP